MRLSLSFPRRAAAAVALVAAVAACGSTPSTTAEQAPDQAPAEVVRAAAAATQQAGSSRYEFTSVTQVQGQTVEFSGTGSFDPATKQGSATFTLPGGLGTTEQRLVGEELFLSVPGQPGFYRIAVADLVGTELANAAHPTGSLDALESVSDDVQEVGTGSVRGEETTHYTGTLDAREAVQRTGGALGELAEQGIGAAGLESLPFEIWIDDEGRTRRFSTTIDIPASEATGGQTVSSTTTIELFDFGVEVAVEPPPADQVRDGSELVDALRGGVSS